VDAWFHFLKDNDVRINQPPRTHRDGARSFYCYDPAGTLVQMIYHPPLV
ncbi:MAG TPA: glyoxalase, partial [Gammaproteobacteria bacterium]|nr:glyoxalase [Gammaproteobacteria bacterium]